MKYSGVKEAPSTWGLLEELSTGARGIQFPTRTGMITGSCWLTHTKRTSVPRGLTAHQKNATMQ